MSSGSSSLPPSALAGASAQARIDQIAVRLISVPDGIRPNAGSLRLSGEVTGQNNDGSLTIRTDKGDVKIQLRDRSGLPQGLKIDIDIPAGRNAQQATIRPSEQSSSGLTAPSIQIEPSVTQAIQQLPPPKLVEPETLGRVLRVTQETGVKDTIPAALPVARGDLQTGQMVRLLPVPPGSLPPDLQKSLMSPLPFGDLLSSLVTSIESMGPTTSPAIKNSLLMLLSKIDLTPLKNPSGSAPATAFPTLQTNAQLLERVQKLLQSAAGTPFNAPQGPSGQQAFPSGQSQGLSLFNPSKFVDGQVVAFQQLAGGQGISTGPQSSNSSGFQQIPVFSVMDHSGETGQIFAAGQAQNQTTKITTTGNFPVTPAQILGFSEHDLPILSVPLPSTGLSQLYTMQFSATNLAAGTPVFLTLDPQTTRPVQITLVQSADGKIALDSALQRSALGQWINSGNWDSLDDVLKTLGHLSPSHAAPLLHMIPNPAQSQTMGALGLFFLSFLRSGESVDTLLGHEAMTLLRQMGKSETLRALTSDLAAASRLDHLASLSQDWQMTLLPMLWEDQVHKLPLYYKHLPDNGDQGADQAKKRRRLRFLFDLSLSRMGGVQVDGFMQSERLDIILRTKSPLSVPMQSQMKKIYAGAMDKSRLTGDLTFQFKPEHWVDLTTVGEKSSLNA